MNNTDRGYNTLFFCLILYLMTSCRPEDGRKALYLVLVDCNHHYNAILPLSAKKEMNECTMLRQIQAHTSVGGKECMAGRKNGLSLLVFVVLYSGFDKELGSS